MPIFDSSVVAYDEDGYDSTYDRMFPSVW
jgi:hypothetical protein